MTFKYKKRPQPRPLNLGGKPQFADTPEQLTGEVNGIPASDLEERLVKSARKSSAVRQVIFRMTLGGPRGAPGWLELDALLDTTYGFMAFEVDDVSFIHKGESERQEALLKDIRRVEALQEMGINLIPQRNGEFIGHVTNEDLGTQEDADRWGRENL